MVFTFAGVLGLRSSSLAIVATLLDVCSVFFFGISSFTPVCLNIYFMGPLRQTTIGQIVDEMAVTKEFQCAVFGERQGRLVDP